jgi:hypothetical protein
MDATGGGHVHYRLRRGIKIILEKRFSMVVGLFSRVMATTPP